MASDIVFNNGLKAPTIGLGTWQIKGDELKTAVRTALDVGYRHIDSAFLYGNEVEIGEVLNEYFKSDKLTRDKVFITSKARWHLVACYEMLKDSMVTDWMNISNQTGDGKLVLTYMMLAPIYMGPSMVKTNLEKSLGNFQLSYLDLYLIHMPTAVKNGGDGENWPKDENGHLEVDGELLDTWKQMEELVDEGKVKSIGVSNFNSEQLERICKNARIKPVTNQVECHVYFQQKELQAFCGRHGIVITAYAPLGSPCRPVTKQSDQPVVVLDDNIIKDMARKYNKTSAQVLLQNLLQRGIIVIPKSSNPNRIKENFQVLDFTITDEDMNTIANLDKKKRLFPMDFEIAFCETQESLYEGLDEARYMEKYQSKIYSTYPYSYRPPII